MPRPPQNRMKSFKLPSRLHPAAPTVLQHGPEVPKWSPGCSRVAEMVSQNVKMEHRAPQMATPRAKRGRRQRFEHEWMFGQG